MTEVLTSCVYNFKFLKKINFLRVKLFNKEKKNDCPFKTLQPVTMVFT